MSVIERKIDDIGKSRTDGEIISLSLRDPRARAATNQTEKKR